MRPPVHISLAVGLLILHPVSTNSEELLIKRTGKYLGWKIPEDRFMTCDEAVLKIENGRIEKTTDKCRKPPPPGPVLQWGGTLEAANSETGIVRILRADGKSIDLYLAPESDSWPRLKKLQMGVPVKAVGPVSGRAERIEAVERKVGEAAN